MNETYDIGELSFCNQILRLGTNKLLLQNDQFCALGLLCLQLRDLIRNLDLVISARLNALLCIPDRLQDRSAIIEVVRIEVLLLSKFRQQDANLIRYVANSIICGCLAPVGKLGCDGKALFPSSFVGLDEVVLGFDQLVKLLAQFWLGDAAKGAEAETMTRRARARFLLAGSDRERAVPAEREKLAPAHILLGESRL